MRLLLATLLTAFTLTALADTVIESREPGGKTGRISISGDWVRFDDAGGGGEGYMLMNAKQRRFYVVVPGERTIIEFGSKPYKKGEQPAVEFRDGGNGPRIAGYATRKYELLVGGESCGQRFYSTQAAEIADLRSLLSAIGGFNPEAFMPEEMVQGFRDRTNPCDMAELRLDEKERAKLGFPMKRLDPEGNIESEVVSITRNASLKDGLFDLPQGYARTSVKEMMEGMRREMENNREQIERMLKEMSPEERTRLEQMMKQFGGAKQ